MIARYWPTPESHSKSIPTIGFPGSFWEDRDDRYHCGVDIYAPEGSGVLSIEDGEVIDIGISTSPNLVPYWHKTSYVSIKNRNKQGHICKYAELGDIKVKIGDSVQAGQLIGHVGLVLNLDKITDDSPLYIQKIKKKENGSMLHFELFKSPPIMTNVDFDYLGGNLFCDFKPESLLDPTKYLFSTLNNSDL